MKTQALLLCLVALAATASATVYFKETFDGDVFSRWIQSDWKKNDGTAGKFDVSAGEWYGDAEKDKGLRTTEDARFYAISSKFDKFSNAGKDLVIQFQVRFPQKIDCGGGYIKVLKSSIEPKKFTGDTEYNIMFGPDICGTSTKRVHVIFSHNGKNHLIKKEIRAEGDQTSHVYTLIVRPDDTYEVRVDNDKKESGKLSEDWDFSAPKKIKDPNAKKPADWVDSPKMDDPNDKKPADWDAIPKEIPDPEAEKPADWDDENDGAWEPPTIPNPDYKGEWKPRQIDNPDYKGPWIHPEIDNPEYVDYTDLYKYDDFGGVGVDVWQVKAGTIFDNIIITDSVSEAERFYRDTFEASKDKEKEMFDAAEKKKRDEEDAQRKKIEEEREKQDKSSKASSSSGSKDEDDDDDDDDDDEAADKIKDKVHEDL